MAKVVIYSSDWCPFSVRAITLLKNKGVKFEEIRVDGKPAVRAEMAKKLSAPQCHKFGLMRCMWVVVMSCLLLSAPASWTHC